MTLYYTPIYTDGKVSELCLVYKPMPEDRDSQLAMMDAITGAALNNVSEPLDKKPSPQTLLMPPDILPKKRSRPWVRLD